MCGCVYCRLEEKEREAMETTKRIARYLQAFRDYEAADAAAIRASVVSNRLWAALTDEERDQLKRSLAAEASREGSHA
jgi:flagellar biosynthesis regulator FlaF